MGASASRNWLVGVSALEPEPEEALGLGQLPTELLEMVLSHVPPHVLLGCCRRVCRRWRDLVDSQALWLSILARDHAALSPVLRTCLPPADDPRPCVLGRFCELRPIGRNLLQNPKGEGGEPRKGVLLKGAGACPYSPRAWVSQEASVGPGEGGLLAGTPGQRKDQQRTDCIYQLTVRLLDANQAILDHFSPLPFPIWKWRNSKGVRFVSFECRIWDLEFRNEQYGISVTNSSVIVQGPARQGPHSGPPTQGGAGSGPTAHRAARDGAEPRAPSRAARALPPGVQVLARPEHAALWSIVSTCLPPADDRRPCILGRFCERRPIGRNLLPNPKGKGGEPRKGVLMGAEAFLKWTPLSGGDAWGAEENWEVTPRAYRQTSFLSSYRWCHKKEVLDLEEEGFWPELLDSGKMEICVSDWKGVCFVSFEHWVRDIDFCSQPYVVYLFNSSVIVRVRLS
eukprot:bmy_16335T0